MILISHRGNTNGVNHEKENTISYVKDALNLGFDVEVDVWYHEDNFYLGHDEPKYKTNKTFLRTDGLWCHAKNIDALNHMLEDGKIHCFWHQEDDVTLTSEGYMWTYPNKQLTDNSIAVLPELWKTKIEKPKVAVGICSDFIVRYV